MCLPEHCQVPWIVSTYFFCNRWYDVMENKKMTFIYQHNWTRLLWLIEGTAVETDKKQRSSCKYRESIVSEILRSASLPLQKKKERKNQQVSIRF